MGSDLDQRDILLFMAQQKSPGLCAILELLGCVFGFSGVGIMLGGRVGLGLVVMVGYWIWVSFWSCVGLGTFGLGFLAIPFWWLVTTISALQTAQAHNAQLLRSIDR